MVVLVTGGSSGIGLAAVKRLADAGHQVFSASRRPARAELPAGVTPLPFDAADASAAPALVARVIDEAGRLDVLVNNAGTATVQAVEESTDADAHDLMEVNLFGPARLIRAAIPLMRAQGGGRIVKVSSVNDILPAPFSGWYSASKAAVSSLSYVLRAELRGSGIHVTVLAPGFFLTDMAKSLSDEAPDARSAYADALGRLREENLERLPGADAAGFESLVRGSTADDVAAMLADYVAGLSAG